MVGFPTTNIIQLNTVNKQGNMSSVLHYYPVHQMDPVSKPEFTDHEEKHATNVSLLKPFTFVSDSNEHLNFTEFLRRFWS